MARVRVAARAGANRGAWQWIALLRAANTGGPTTLRNADLKRVFDSAGFSDVRTYGQSGNVVLTASISSRDELTRVVEERLRAHLGRPIDVFVLSPAELRHIEADNPFGPAERGCNRASHVMVLASQPDETHRDALMASQGNDYCFAVRDRALYFTYPRESERHRRTVDFEKLLGVRGTARSSRVMAKLVELTS